MLRLLIATAKRRGLFFLFFFLACSISSKLKMGNKNQFSSITHWKFTPPMTTHLDKCNFLLLKSLLLLRLG